MSFKDTLKAQTHNIRDYGMYIAFVVIVIFFTIATKGVFISSRNIGNLVNATSYIAVLAVGMTLVIVIRHIDLSVGYLAGTLGAIAAIALKYWHLPVFATIPMVLVLGIIAGLVTAFLVAQMRIPAFVATLAGWLFYRGTLQLVTRSTGTIIIENDIFNALGNGFIPDIPIKILPGIHIVTLLLGLLAIILFITGEISNRKKTQAYNFEVLPLNMFILKLVGMSAHHRCHHLGARRLPGSLLGCSYPHCRGSYLFLYHDQNGSRKACLCCWWKSRGSRAKWHQCKEDYLFRFWLDGYAHRFSGYLVCLLVALSYHHCRSRYGIRCYRCSICWWCGCGWGCWQGYRVDPRCSGDGVTNQWYEPPGLGHIDPIYRQSSCPCRCGHI